MGSCKDNQATLDLLLLERRKWNDLTYEWWVRLRMLVQMDGSAAGAEAAPSLGPSCETTVDLEPAENEQNAL